jgi:hypothetical protein
MLRNLAPALVFAALTGCGSLAQPMSAAEFRQLVGGSSLGTVVSFDVARPYPQVVDTLRKKSDECLAVTATSSGTVFQGNMAMRETSTSVYKPTMSIAGERMELAVQVDFGAHTTVQKKPDGGFYILVADAVPAGAGAKVTIYRGRLGKAEDIGNAIREWATGASTSCPKLGA